MAQETIKIYNPSLIKLITAHEFCELIEADRYKTQIPTEDPLLRNNLKFPLINGDDCT
jgi:hypothetical protein